MEPDLHIQSHHKSSLHTDPQIATTLATKVTMTSLRVGIMSFLQKPEKELTARRKYIQ